MAKVLGISAFYHDSAAAITDGQTVCAAAQEERFTRIKHDAAFPHEAIRSVLEQSGITLEALDAIVFYDKPFLKFERLLQTYVALAPKGLASFSKAMPVWMREKLFLKNVIVKELNKLMPGYDGANLRFTEHHFAHAASAFFPSPFDEAVVLTLDGVGEWATSTVAIGKGKSLEIKKEIHFPHSLGLLYSAFTYHTGFKVNSGEYKLMGLAPYGEPRFAELILDKLIDVRSDGSFRLDMSYFDYATGLRMTNKKFDALFGATVREPESELLTQFHMDLAASIQRVTETIILKIARSLSDQHGIENLCLAGGVALNCVANGKLLRDGAFPNLWIQPAAGDAGGAVGAALAVAHGEFGIARSPAKPDGMKGAYLGPAFDQVAVEKALKESGARYEIVSDEERTALTARALVDGNAVGWFQGRMEFGPRALGGRSILADPRDPKAQSTLNLKVKFRESFRPFAPSILREEVGNWFDIDCDSPYMLLVADVEKKLRKDMTKEESELFGIEKLNVPRSEIPAVTHVDYSARVQTVHRETNPEYYDLIAAFKDLTGCPILVNTSFNVRGEPIVGSPKDAFHCFMGTGIDMLVCGNAVLWKKDQDPALLKDYSNQFELD